MIIYKGKRAVCGIQLTIDRVWRYAMTNEDVLIVHVKDCENHTVEKTYTSEAVDSIDKIITIELESADTEGLTSGNGYIAAYMNDLCVLQPSKILIKEAL